MESATTPPIDAAPIEAGPRSKHSSSSRQVRGSSLMLLGRGISMAVTFTIQVLIVHFLSKANYGAFAYALSFVTVGQTICLLEAMKLFNELKSEHAGVISKVLVEDGTAVEFGQPLFVIE